MASEELSLSMHDARVRKPRVQSWRRPTAFAVLGIAAFLSVPAAAQDLRIAGISCAEPVHLVAKDIPLSTVLQALSASLHFDVVYQARTDPAVTIETTALAPDLVQDIARNMNFSLEEATDARCAHLRRIVKLSVLSDPAGGNRGAIASARPAWQTPEMERIGRLGLQDYLESHGMANQPIEQLAVH